MTADPGKTADPAVAGDPGRRLSAALRAQAAAVPAGHTPDPAPAPLPRSPARQPTPASGREQREPQTGSTLSVWAVLALAALVGAVAGGLAGVISAW